MLVPLSWLKEYVPITMPLNKLIERLSEGGVGVEAVHKKEEDTVLELEITPNRPDLLSIVGVAREVAAIQNSKVTLPRISSIAKAKKLAKGQSSSGRKLPITIRLYYSLTPRVSALIIDGIKVKESPLWLQERLTSIGLRSINTIVDITNFVMFELGNPLHAFDYDQVKGHTMIVAAANGGEPFTTVDKITYKLPKGANIIKDRERIIDLCGIKGGLNCAITEKTKRVILWVAVDDGPNIRKTCQTLDLHSDASHIYERGVNRGGTLDALVRAASLILELAGGRVASNVIDLKKAQYKPWLLSLSLNRLEKILGIAIADTKVLKILTALNLSPKKRGDSVEVTVPTYRNDLQIEEDLIEEVARMYGYNKFPRTLPKGAVPITNIPYASGFDEELRIKQAMVALGFAEANTYSLVSREEAKLVSIPQEQQITVANPVSQEFEVLRPSLLINLLKAIPLNAKYQEHILLFELGKVYGKKGKASFEKQSLAAVLSPSDYFEAKGVVEGLFDALTIPVRFAQIDAVAPYHRNKLAGIFIGKEQVGTVGEIKNQQSCAFELDFDLLVLLSPPSKKYHPIPKYPPLIEDLSIVVDREVLTGNIIDEIHKTSALIAKISFLDIFENTRTFRITYQHPEKNLSSPEVALIRHQILSHLKKKFGAQLKT